MNRGENALLDRSGEETRRVMENKGGTERNLPSGPQKGFQRCMMNAEYMTLQVRISQLARLLIRMGGAGRAQRLECYEERKGVSDGNDARSAVQGRVKDGIRNERRGRRKGRSEYIRSILRDVQRCSTRYLGRPNSCLPRRSMSTRFGASVH